LIREITEDGRLPVVDAEAVEELAVGGETAPALGDDGCTQEVGGCGGMRNMISWRRSSSSSGFANSGDDNESRRRRRWLMSPSPLGQYWIWEWGMER
jgi:hypothetical protein